MANATKSSVPDWDTLFEIAVAQDGHFTTTQAADAGYSPQLLNHHVQKGRLRRVRYSIYRVVHFPAGEHEDLTVLWLWSHQEGVFSHETALAAHGLSDALPAQVHLTLPTVWKRRRLRVPEGVMLYHADVPTEERAWFGSVPVTAPARTVIACAKAHTAPELVEQAVTQGRDRGLFSEADVQPAILYLADFGRQGP